MNRACLRWCRRLLACLGVEAKALAAVHVAAVHKPFHQVLDFPLKLARRLFGAPANLPLFPIPCPPGFRRPHSQRLARLTQDGYALAASSNKSTIASTIRAGHTSNAAARSGSQPARRPSTPPPRNTTGTAPAVRTSRIHIR